MTNELTPTGNPQGKGLVAVVDDFHTFTPQRVFAKSRHQWLADYFTSILVLNAECALKPVINKTYYLYLKNDIWKLSLIEPSAWSTEVSGIYFAACVLHSDRTWSVTPKEKWQQSKILLDTIEEIQNDFLNALNNEKPLLEQLPFFAEHLPYYRRISANALARSLQKSLTLEIGNEPSQKLTGRSLLTQLDHASNLLAKP
jgi:hypothetical protein